MIDYAQIDKEREKLFQRDMKRAMDLGASERTFFGAVATAHNALKESELLPSRNEDGDEVYSDQQGRRAACHAREDAAATLALQLPVLKDLRSLKLLLWGCFGLLLYIAVRVS
ncbi:hypothetical protein [Variovorax sp. UC122_21]|uniref:hypothetical protein n=1 Tax=Variovorax sp. UC122_21 TaxID=3374554 RepID=UPI00375779C1